MEYMEEQSGDNQPSLSPVSSLRKPELPPDLRLFKRITMLTLFLGILIGMLMVDLAVMAWDYGLIPGVKVTFHLATPVVDGLLGPLLLILLGAIYILRWRVSASYKRLARFRPDLERATNPYTPSMWMQASGGFAFLFMGCFFLIEKLVDYSIGVPIIILPICFFAWLILTYSVDLYLAFRSKSYMRRE